jgi:hypothetical protein
VLEKELGVKAGIEVGPSGKFIVEVDGQPVAEKGMIGFPSEEEIVAAVRKKMQAA